MACLGAGARFERWAVFPVAGRAAAALAVALALSGAPRLVHAGTEEFSTFDVELQEEDDESMLDHVLTRSPRAWRSEWERAPQALRTEQGCLTSGQWFIHTDLKLETALGTKARLGVLMRQSEDDVAHFNYLDLAFRFPIRYGMVSAAFRPIFDKSEQDFALSWETGADTSALQIRATFGLEDLFNNLWSFRQTRVGNASEPYVKHPFEPALHIATRHERWRAELDAKYLTPSRKSLVGPTPDGPRRAITLWGTAGTAVFECDGLGFEWEMRGGNQQAFSTDALEGSPFGDNGNYRRNWSAEGAVRHAAGSKLTAEARYIYQGRAQNHRAPAGPGGFGALDRTMGLELLWRATPALSARFGGLFDRVGVAESGLVFGQSYGTRNESRGYLGLAAHFGRVSVSGVEGIELDPERYEVWFVHDKGFLQLQAVF